MSKNLMIIMTLFFFAFGVGTSMAQQYCQYSDSRGHWNGCYDGSELCGGYQYCVHASCYGTGQEIVNGCVIRPGVQCIFGGCFSAFIFYDCFSC